MVSVGVSPRLLVFRQIPVAGHLLAPGKVELMPTMTFRLVAAFACTRIGGIGGSFRDARFVWFQEWQCPFLVLLAPLGFWPLCPLSMWGSL